MKKAGERGDNVVSTHRIHVNSPKVARRLLSANQNDWNREFSRVQRSAFIKSRLYDLGPCLPFCLEPPPGDFVSSRDSATFDDVYLTDVTGAVKSDSDGDLGSSSF